MRLDQKVERPQGGGTRADLVGERGQAELDAFVRIAIALTVQRLVLAELLEQDHRKQARAEHAARGRVDRRGRLTYRFAGAAGRSEERRGGKECVSTCSSRGSPCKQKKRDERATSRVI